MTFPFGKYQGQRLADIPREYLLWSVKIARQPLKRAIEAELMRRDDQDTHEYYRRRDTGAQPEVRFVRTIVERGFRACAKELHPDHGGRHEDMVALNDAREWLQAKIEVLT